MVDLVKLETSFTDTMSLSHPATTLTFETECAAAAASSRHRQSVDGFVVEKQTEFPGKLVESRTTQRTMSLTGVVPLARPSIVSLLSVT